MASVYQVNKGVNRPVTFKGLKAQYIWWLGGGLVVLLMVFAILYVIGVNMYLCLGIILIAGFVLFAKVYQMSNKYGEYGMMKKIARRSIPKLVRNNSRKCFIRQESKNKA